MDTVRSTNKVKSGRKTGERLIRGMEGLRDALRDGVPLEDRFTMRTVEFRLEEPGNYTAEDVAALRDRLRASQGVFAKLLGVSIKTVQAWEQGGNPPSATARRLLDVIQHDPKPWEQLLRKSAVAAE